MVGAKHWTKTVFLNFSGTARISRQGPRYPTKKFGFPRFRGTNRTCWPPPLHMEDPNPTGRYPDPKVWACPPFLPERNEPKRKLKAPSSRRMSETSRWFPNFSWRLELQFCQSVGRGLFGKGAVRLSHWKPWEARKPRDETSKTNPCQDTTTFQYHPR